MPAYNASKKIESVFEKVPPEVLESINQFIIVVDGATDNTLEKAKLIQEKYEKIIIIVHDKNKGYGAAQKTGFDKALQLGAEIIILLHADGQLDPTLIPKVIEPIKEKKAKMVLGSRMLKTNPFNTPMPFYKYCGNKFLTFIENIALRSNISEFHTGYIAYSREALEKINYHKLDNRFHFDGHMIIMAIINKILIKEVPVPVIYDDEKSHLNPLGYGINVIKTIWKYKTGYFHKLN